MYQLTIDDVLMLLLYNDDIVIITHKKPDGDTLGTGAALCRALRAKGKTAYLHNNEDITPKYAELCKELLCPAEFTPKFIVAVDTADVQLFPKSAEQYKSRVDLVIDHHPSNTGYGGHTYVEPGAAATGEIIYTIIDKMAVGMGADIMEGIYIAVATDTGCFRYSNTTAKAHMVAAKAVEAGVNVAKLNRQLFETKSKARFRVEAKLIENMKSYYADKLAVSFLSREFIDEIQASEDDLDNVSTIMRSIEGVECAITAIELANGDYKFSVRSNDQIDASYLCSLFGGGGHKKAAGCTVKYNGFTGAVATMIEVVGNLLHD